jgi:large subunit ribosomal protein L25
VGETVELAVEDRQIQGKAVKALRKQGFMPAVVYGSDFKARSVMAPQLQAVKAFRQAGKHHPIELHIGQQTHLAMVKSVDIDPVKRTLRHLAFQTIKQNEAVETEVPITILGSGETPAERAGLIILTNIDKVQISALPKDLPDSIGVPGEKLVGEGDRLTVAELIVPKGVTIKSEPTQVVATVYEPSALAAQQATDEEEATDEAVQEVPSEHGGEETATDEADDKKA